MQPGSPRSSGYDPALTENRQAAGEQIVEINLDSLLIRDDLTRNVGPHRFKSEEMKGDLDALPFPCYAVPGNMNTHNKHAHRNGMWVQPAVREGGCTGGRGFKWSSSPPREAGYEGARQA